MKMKITTITSLFCAVAIFTSCGSNSTEETNGNNMSHEHHHESKSPSDMQASSGRVFFANIKDGDTLTNPVSIEFGVEGMEVRPAGDTMLGTGHHHLLIGSDSIPTGEVVPANDTHIHYGGGQTSDTVTLPVGNTKIALQFADGTHASYGSKMSSSISVVVK